MTLFLPLHHLGVNECEWKAQKSEGFIAHAWRKSTEGKEQESCHVMTLFSIWKGTLTCSMLRRDLSSIFHSSISSIKFHQWSPSIHHKHKIAIVIVVDPLNKYIKFLRKVVFVHVHSMMRMNNERQTFWRIDRTFCHSIDTGTSTQ